MTVKCISREIPVEVRRQVGWHEKVNPQYQLTPGKSYIVYGMAVPIKRVRTGLFWTIFCILNDQDRFSQVPEDLLEIVDCSAPMEWQINVTPNKIMYGYPILHNEKSFEDLAEGSIWALADLKREDAR